MTVRFKGLRLKTGLLKPLYKPDFGNTGYLRRQHWWRDVEKNYSKLLLLGRQS